MTIKPGDQWKAAVLGILIVGFGVYGYFAISSTLAKNASTPTTPVQQLSSADPIMRRSIAPESAQPGIAGGAGRIATDADIEEETKPTPPVGRDPFQPPRAVPVPASERGQEAATAQAARKNSSPKSPGGSQIVLPPWPAAGSGGSLNVRPTPESTPSLPAVELKGVIAGEPPLAIVAVGGETFVKREGEFVGGGMAVAKITEAGVVFKQGKRNILVNVGHSTQPSSSAPAPRSDTGSSANLSLNGPDRTLPPVVPTKSGGELPIGKPASSPVRTASSPETATTGSAPKPIAHKRKRRYRRIKRAHHMVAHSSHATARRITHRRRYVGRTTFVGRRL
jgi:hypothetical protein